MASKPTKQEALDKLETIPDLPRFLAKLPAQAGLAARVIGASKGLARLLIEIDPLKRTQHQKYKDKLNK